MTAEILFRKRLGREGEMGLFVETPVFDEEWGSLKIGAEVKAICTVPAHLRYVNFFHALCGKVADNCDWLLDKDDAKERILLEARHAKIIHDPLRNKTEIKAKSVAGLSGDQWIRLLRRCTHVVVTKFIPGMDDNALKAEIEAMIGPETPASAPEPSPAKQPARQRKRDPEALQGQGEPASGTAGNANPAAPLESSPRSEESRPAGAPTNEAEYLIAARAWVAKQTDHAAALAYLDGTPQIELRAKCRLSVGAGKMIRRELAEHCEKVKADAVGR